MTGLVSGIPPKGKKRKAKTITAELTEEKQPLGKGSSYCRMCCRKLAEEIGCDGKKLNREQKLDKLGPGRWSTLRCTHPLCREQTSGGRWAEGYDKHQSL